MIWLKSLTYKRVKLLQLLWNGITDIELLARMMLTRKNVIYRLLKLLENHGIIRIKGNSIELIKTPRNLCLLYTLNIISLEELLKELFNYFTNELGSNGNLELILDNDGKRVYIRHEGRLVRVNSIVRSTMNKLKKETYIISL